MDIDQSGKAKTLGKVDFRRSGWDFPGVCRGQDVLHQTILGKNYGVLRDVSTFGIEKRTTGDGGDAGLGEASHRKAAGERTQSTEITERTQLTYLRRG